MLNKAFSLFSGCIFGFGLTVSSMTNPAKVIGFLDITGKWDPSLMFVMIGAIFFCSIFFYLLRNLKKPIFYSKFELPTYKKVDRKLIIGSSLFGIGWGTVGFCPGPAISSISFFQPSSIIFLISMFVGFYLVKYIKFNH